MIKKLAIAIALVAVAGVAVAAGAWYFFIRSDSPPAVSLANAVNTLAGTPAAGSPTASSSSTDVKGSWSIVPNDNNFVGYRVNEQLAGIGANLAVGRTSNVKGDLVFDGKSITSVNITADLSSLKSDKAQRDRSLQRQSLETATYPTATFALTEPVQIGSTPSDGDNVSKTVKGNLTLHGVTKPVSMDVQGQLKNGQLVVVGSMTVNFADFNIKAPTAPAVLGTDDHGVMEMQLVFGKSLT